MTRTRLAFAALVTMAGWASSACDDDGDIDASAGDAAVDAPAGPTLAEQQARGKYLVDHVVGCIDCHSSRGPAGFLPGMYLAGNDCLFDIVPADTNAGCIHTPNLTSDVTGTGNLTAQQIVDILKTGIRPDGRALHSVMPYYVFANAREADLMAIAQYLKVVPPVSKVVAPSQPPWATAPAAPAPAIDLSGVPQPSATYPDQAAAARGRYLATSIGACIECHTQHNAPGPGPVLTTKYFQGNEGFTGLLPSPPFPMTIYSANITPDPGTGIGIWNVADVVKALKMGINKAGQGLCPPMPAGPMGPFGGLTDSDATDIGHYLLSIQPVVSPLSGQCVPPPN